MGHFTYLKKIAAGIAVVAALSAVTVMPALAVDTVTGEVTAGSLTASIANADLGATGYSNEDTSLTGELSLNVVDERSSGAGWSVTVAASVFDGLVTTDTIPGANLAITSYGAQTVNFGQTTPAPAIGATGSLGGPVSVLGAIATSGQGDYTQVINVQLDIDGTTLADTYTSTLTIAYAAAP